MVYADLLWDMVICYGVRWSIAYCLILSSSQSLNVNVWCPGLFCAMQLCVWLSSVIWRIYSYMCWCFLQRRSRSSSQSSNVSVSIESALGAFDFLNTEDVTDGGDIVGSPEWVNNCENNKLLFCSRPVYTITWICLYIHMCIHYSILHGLINNLPDILQRQKKNCEMVRLTKTRGRNYVKGMFT